MIVSLSKVIDVLYYKGLLWGLVASTALLAEAEADARGATGARMGKLVPDIQSI